MTVIVANDILPAARGLLRRWFLEPRPNVFVGSVNARTREKTLDYIRRNSPGVAMLVIFDDNSSQGYAVLSFGDPNRRLVRRSGLGLILENPEELAADGAPVIGETAKPPAEGDRGHP